MKKLFIPLSLIAAALLVFVACRKNEKILDVEKEFSIESVKEWYNAKFVNTTEYTNGTIGSGIKKMPNWKMGEVYTIGDVKIAEFPLLIDKRKVYVSEKLSEANAKRVVEHTRYKVIFVQAPNKKIQVRIVQFTPTFDYLQSKNFNLSKLSFKDYQKDFKGDIMLFDFDNNFKNGYHFSNEKLKVIHLKTKFPNQNVNSRQPFCDNGVTLDPNCHYTIHTVFEIICTNGWNIAEGFHPNYCSIGQIISIECELQYCDPPPNEDQDLTDCMASGSTQADCMCSLYGLGCGDDGDDDETCNASTVIQTIQSNLQDCSTESFDTKSTENTIDPEKKGMLIHWLIGWSGVYTFRVWCWDKFISTKTNGIWKVTSGNNVSVNWEGTIVGATSIENPVYTRPSIFTFPENGNYGKVDSECSIKYSVSCSAGTVTIPYTSTKNFTGTRTKSVEYLTTD
jgi:hypothetical protein